MFIKKYPYLEDISFDSSNTKAEKRLFLNSLKDYPIQKKYVRIILLDWKENPVSEIQGEITNGTLTKDGNSTCRRSCSLSVSFNSREYNVEDIENSYSIKHKVFLEIGINNYTKYYRDYPILWFPQGVFVIKDFNFNSSTTTAINATIQLRDKMALLNGDCGGQFQSTVVLDSEDSQIRSGEYVSEKVPIYRIIQELVNHFGEENLDNIIIENVPLKAQKIMKWTGLNPLYLVPQSAETTNISYIPQVNQPSGSSYLTITSGMDAGYILTDFVYPGELSVSPKETITSALDKIKSTLGNYEYFYDEYGRFHFREVRNYLNTSQSTLILNEVNNSEDGISLGTPAAYLVDLSYPKSDYTFEDNEIVASINVSPKYDNIRNDYVVHGTRKGTTSDIAFDIMYHLAIDKKPKLQEHHNILLYNDPDSQAIKARIPFVVNSLPTVGDFNLIYMMNNSIYYWDGSEYKELNKIYYGDYTPKDWRTELYLRGVEGLNLGLSATQYEGEADANFYFPELDAFWPNIYNLQTQQFYGQTEQAGIARVDALTNGNYFIDFIDSTSTSLGQYSIANIGRRSDVVVDNNINCLFIPEIPNINFINIDEDDFFEQVNECIRTGIPYAQTRGDIYNALQMGGTKVSAYDQIKHELYYHTNFQRTASLTAYPIYYLEPNIRISINDKTSQTYGDFMIQSISIPLGISSTINISMNETTDRFE